MFTLELVLVTVLLQKPCEITHAQWELHYPTFVTILLSEQLADKREFAATNNLSYTSGINVGKFLEDRMKFQNYPRIEENQFFGDNAETRKYINEQLVLNRKFLEYLNRRLTVDCFHEDIIKEAIQETNQLYHAYDLLRDSTTDYYYVTVRREALNQLRELIGAEAFYSRQMPPVIPLRHVPRR